MKNSELYEVMNVLTEMSSIKGAKVAYFVAKNMKRIKNELAILEETAKPSDKFMEYENKRVELAASLGKKDENGNLVIVNNSYTFTDEARAEFSEKLKVLVEEYKDAIDERNKQAEGYECLMNDVANVDFYKIDEKELGDEATGVRLMVLSELFNEELA